MTNDSPWQHVPVWCSLHFPLVVLVGQESSGPSPQQQPAAGTQYMELLHNGPLLD